jgi:hypothetical protein
MERFCVADRKWAAVVEVRQCRPMTAAAWQSRCRGVDGAKGAQWGEQATMATRVVLSSADGLRAHWPKFLLHESTTLGTLESVDNDP